jgi:hypothetical protein
MRYKHSSFGATELVRELHLLAQISRPHLSNKLYLAIYVTKYVYTVAISDTEKEKKGQ